MAVAQVHVVPFVGLNGQRVRERDGLHGTDFHAHLLAARPALFVPVGRVLAQVAFLGMPILEVPLHARRREGACFHAPFAADAFSLVDHARSGFRIGMHRAGRARLDARGVRALTTLVLAHVVHREASQRILHDLDARQRRVDPAQMRQRTGNHARLASGAFLSIHQQISLRRLDGVHVVGQRKRHNAAAQDNADSHASQSREELTAR